jgi:transposase
VDRDWLKRELEAGRSIEAIAAEVDRDPSTVAYWVNKHELVSVHASKHAPKGGVEREALVDFIERGMSVRQIAAKSGMSATTIRYWLKKYGLATRPARYTLREEEPEAVLRECGRHGWTEFGPVGARRHFRCRQCNRDAVAERRRKVKEILVAEAGGACAVCGYDRYAGALHFHHCDPSEKAFGLALGGVTRSIDLLRLEAAKCVLLCGNCHSEVENGGAVLPDSAPG